MLPKINKADMAGTMEVIKKYLRTHCSVIRAPLAYIMKKTILVKTYDDYLKHATPDDEVIARMIHLSPDKNKLLLECNDHSVKEHTAEYKIDNRTFFDVWNQIHKDSDLYSYVKQHKSKRDGIRAFHAIHSRWLCPNHMNMIASEAEAA